MVEFCWWLVFLEQRGVYSRVERVKLLTLRRENRKHKEGRTQIEKRGKHEKTESRLATQIYSLRRHCVDTRLTLGGH